MLEMIGLVEYGVKIVSWWGLRLNWLSRERSCKENREVGLGFFRGKRKKKVININRRLKLVLLNLYIIVLIVIMKI